jgi:hypothetical protein
MERASSGQGGVSVPSALAAPAGDLRTGAGDMGFVDATGGLCDSVIIILMIYIRRFFGPSSGFGPLGSRNRIKIPEKGSNWSLTHSTYSTSAGFAPKFRRKLRISWKF